MTIYLGLLLPITSSDLPGIRRHEPYPLKSESLLGLAPDGACRATLVTKCAVSSYLTVSPLPAIRLAVCFLLRYPSHYCAWTLSSILLYGARTFLQPKAGGHPLPETNLEKFLQKLFVKILKEENYGKPIKH